MIRRQRNSLLLRAVACLAMAALPTLCALPACGERGPLDRSRFVDVDELRPGDRCVGRTVFSGDRVEEFDVEIIGVVRGSAPASDVIIIRATGGPLDRAGIMEGMSGSPVYRDGRLVGAISSTWAFAEEAIGGVTPIGEMLPALDLFDDAGSARGDGTGGALGVLVMPEGELAVSRAAWLLDAGGVVAEDGRGLADSWGHPTFDGCEMAQISLPLVVSGASERFLGRLTGALSGLGFAPVKGASGAVATTSAGPTDLVPGSAVGVQLVRGDANWTAVGTVTHREGDRLIAFGHPLFQAGDVELPMVGAYVHAVMPLQSVSFKYASGAELAGTMVQDRRRMVAGRVGDPPAMTPVTVSVRSGDADARTFDLEVVRARPYASIFAGLATAGAIDEVVGTAGASLVDLAVVLETDRGDIRYSDVFHSETPAFRVGGELAALMDLVLANRFEQRRISRVTLDVRVLERERWAEIERIDVGSARYRPGDEVAIAVTLREWRGGSVVERLAIRLPDSVPDGPLALSVCGAAEFREHEKERLGEGLRPRNYDQLRLLIARSKPGNAIVAQLLTDRPGISLAGEEMRGVPGRAALAMARSSTGGVVDPAELAVVAEAESSFDCEVRGARDVVIVVARDR